MRDVVALVVGYMLSGLFLFVSFFGRSLVARRIAEADEEQLRDIRQYTASAWTGWYVGIMGFLSAVGATFLLVRGHLIGIGWWGVAIVYAAAVVGVRRRRDYVLGLIGERGQIPRVVRSTRNERRLLIARRFATVGIVSWVALRVIEYAYPEPVPDGATVAIAAVGIIAFVGAVGWLAMRTRVYLALDEDKQAAREEARAQDPT